MSERAVKSAEVRNFILDNIEAHPRDIAKLTAKTFGMARESVARYIRALLKEGVLSARGNTKARVYRLKNFVDHFFELDVTPELEEDVEWRTKIIPLMSGVPEEVLKICEYGFDEMVNNVHAHSESSTARIAIKRNARRIELDVIDHGVGIFNKIQKHFGLNDPRHALLELSKGKLTTDKSHHSGEGIFFSSRAFDEFFIRSGTLFFTRRNQSDHEFLLEVNDRHAEYTGTWIQMVIQPDATQTLRDVMEHYQDDKIRFSRTHVPIQLAVYEGESLVSRSQAKRILARFDQFQEVWLDFRGVAEIGQTFADEIFRVFKGSHPEIELMWSNTTPEVDRVIDRVLIGQNQDQGALPI